MQVSRKTTHRSYLFGDFDKDGVKNIDDYKPFDPKVKDWPDPTKNPSFYHKARFGGFETKFSDVLLEIERDNNRNAPFLKKVIAENPGSYGRIKTVPSTIQKLKRKSYNHLHDISGATIVVSNRKQVRTKAKQIKKKYKHDSRQTDDFYRNPKGGVYYAYHLGLLGKDKAPLEIQIKTEPMEKLHKKMHTAYKQNPKSLKSFRKKAKKLFDLGF